MQKIIPFKKEIVFKNTIEEITSISMDHHLTREDYTVKGNFIVEGEYVSAGKKEPFHFEIPYLDSLDQDYNVESAIIDIDDFYYEVTEPNKLSIHIDILADKLKEKPLIEEEIESIPVVQEEHLEVREEVIENKEEIVEKEQERKEKVEIETEKETISEPARVEEVTQVFSNQAMSEESYMTYKVYIVREGDTISSILEKYQISEENLRKYNVINELGLGDKLIIPNEKI